MKQTDNVGDDEARQRLTLGLFAHFLSEEQVRKGRHYILRHVAVDGLVVLVAVIFVWIGGNLFGFRYQLQNTVLSAHTSNANLSHTIQTKISNYRLTIVQPDNKRQSFSLQDIGLQVDVDGTVTLVRAQQHKFSNRLQWWRPISIRLATSVDNNTLRTFMRDHATIIVEPARDASLALIGGTAQITDGSAGKQYGFANPTHSILEAASALQTEPLRMHLVNQQPAVTAQKLSETKARLDAIVKQPVMLSVDGKTTKPSVDDVAKWVAYTPESPGQPAGISVNTDEVQSYIDDLADQYTHPPRAQISLSNGIIAGSEGVSITNKDQVVDTIARSLLDGKGLNLGLATRHTPFKTISATAADKWIEVDLTNKRLYAYQEASLTRTFLVSAGASATPTVTGTYAIYSKYAKQTMSGPNTDGSHYVQPNVPWINYFYQDYAIHGNYWRPASYFGNVNSSHGCVGLTPSDAAWVYTWAPIGTPVVIHY
ncbi:MAG TPA: L,D-transpeptidase family protein [Candidatus Saccharimonadales bacterium]|nr:L,D-transpeptidase family protein [Candidatus Saccharimonadales bacterium]